MAHDAKLDTAGVFTAAGPNGVHHLFYDGMAGSNRWIVASGNPGVPPAPVSRHPDIDSGLKATVATAGLDGEGFSVGLPCGGSFSRPGRVDALGVLAGHGYVVTRGVGTYAIVEASSSADADEVGSALAERVAGRALDVGAVDLLERSADKSLWCCDLVLPFEGPLRKSDAKALVDREIEGMDLSIASCCEVVPAIHAVPHSAAVLAFRPASARAAA